MVRGEHRCQYLFRLQGNSMKRWLIATVFCLVTIPALAGPPVTPATSSRYGEWLRVNHKGAITYRYTYRGYANGFPPPAMYYYGYPQSGFSYGMGPVDRPN
jgi:hypothetical protein